MDGTHRYTLVGLAGYLTFGDIPLLQGDVLNAYPRANGLVGAARLGLALVVITSYPLQAFAFRASLATFTKAVGRRLGCAGCVGLGGAAERLSSGGAESGRAPLVSPSKPASAAFASSAVGGEQPRGGEQPPRDAAAAAHADASLARHFALDMRSVRVTLTLLGGTTLVALVLENLGTAVAVGGAFMGNMLTFTIPGGVYWLLARRDVAPPRDEWTRRRWTLHGAMAMTWLGAIVCPICIFAALDVAAMEAAASASGGGSNVSGG